jgi:two-component system alkaline phosphatase synthesis response regulator PhoP
MNENILVVEDQEALRMALGDRLLNEGFAVDFACDGITGFQKATSVRFDLMILDVLLPGRNGFDLCRDLRLAGVEVPILLLTSRDTTSDKIVGLKLGADDYVTKPFDMQELVARIEVLLRRGSVLPGKVVYTSGPITVDFSAMEVKKEGVLVRLSALEFRLLRFLLQRRGIALSREKILQNVWGHDGGTPSRTLDVHIAGLRQKLESNPRHPSLIVTVPGLGYRYEG